jgi:hypothetical protein
MNHNATEHEALADQIESFLQRPDGALEQIRDEKTRRRLVEGGRKLAESLELPRETYRRIQYSVCRVHYPIFSELRGSLQLSLASRATSGSRRSGHWGLLRIVV